MKTKIIYSLRRVGGLVALIGMLCASNAQNVPALFDRPGGLVPDEQTAIKIAEVILFPIYGENHIRDERLIGLS